MRGIEKKRTRARRPAAPRALEHVGLAHALATGHAQLGELEHGRRLAPLGQAQGLVGAHDEGQVVAWVSLMQASQVSIVNEGPGRSASMPETSIRSAPATASRHSSSRCSTPGSSGSGLCGGAWTGISSTRSSPSRGGLLRAHHVSHVRRVERPAEEADPCHDRPQGRTWPSPSTRYLNVHSSRRPIGPRAWSFWVELPISAPIPNSPPSVKRVEALT